jgi:hypothetical protein
LYHFDGVGVALGEFGVIGNPGRPPSGACTRTALLGVVGHAQATNTRNKRNEDAAVRRNNRTTRHSEGVAVAVGDTKERQPRAVTIHGGIALPLIELDSLEHAQITIASASAIERTAIFKANSHVVANFERPRNSPGRILMWPHFVSLSWGRLRRRDRRRRVPRVTAHGSDAAYEGSFARTGRSYDS